jgi:outer membrane receptor for ferrienterochelin and colicins
MATVGYAQSSKAKCELTGHVIDAITGEHLPYVSVYIKNTTIGTTTDNSGHFIFKGLPEGKVIVIAKFMGYKTVEKEALLAQGKTIDVMIALAEDAITMNDIVVSANRYEVSRKEASSIVNVLSPLVFENTNSNNLSEGLCFMTGLRVENNCQNCGAQQVRINGLDGQYSQILIDSRPVVSALTGVYGLEQIPTGMIDRVEVLRGGGSALYGSNSIAGTVNIITKEALNNSGQLSSNLTLIGGNTTEINTNLNTSLVGKDHKSGAYVFANIRQRSPFDADADGYTELPELKSSTSGFRGYYKMSDFSKLTAEYHNIVEKRRGGNALGLPPHEADIAEQLDHSINGGGLKLDVFTRDYKQKISIYSSGQHTGRKSFYGGNDFTLPSGQTAYGGYGTTKGTTFDAGGNYSYTFDRLWFMPANLVAGMEYSYDNLNDQIPSYDRDMHQTVHTGSLFLQNEWKNDKVSFLLGGRLDKHNMIDKLIFSPRASMRYSPKEDYAFRAGYSTGFLSPQTFSEDLHVDAAGGTVVLIELSPGLNPERSISYNLSADLYHTFGNVLTNLLVEGFYTTLDDVFVLEDIGTDVNGNIIKTKRNGSGATVMGINLESKAVLGKTVQLQAGVTFQNSEYKQPEAWSDEAEPTKNMLRTPNTYGYFTGTYTGVDNLSLSLSGTYTGSMYVPHLAGYIDKDVLKETSSFVDANFKVAYTFNLKDNAELQMNVGIQNLFNGYQNDFDKGPRRDAGYVYGPIYPRSYFAGIKLIL